MTRLSLTSYCLLGISVVATLGACATKQPEPAPVVIRVQPVDFCVPMNSVTAVEVPAETKIFYATTMVDNPPYEPIERTEKQVRVIREAYVKFVDATGAEVTNTCDKFDGVDAETGVPLGEDSYTESFPNPVQ